VIQTINNHPGYDALLDHAMGNTNEAESLILSCHIAFCRTCKSELNRYEKVGGFYLNNHEELKVSKELWKSILERVEGVEQEDKHNSCSAHKIKTSLVDNDINIPSFLTDYLENDLNTENWNSSINSVRYKDILFKDKKFKGKLLEIPPGRSMPKHGHEANEATLVIHGGYSDEKGNYNKGDLVIANSDEVHSPVSSKEMGCVCLVVYSGSLKFKGLLGSLLNFSKFS